MHTRPLARNLRSHRKKGETMKHLLTLPARRSFPGRFLLVLMAAYAVAGCTGDTGPAGPAGPAGGDGTELVVHFADEGFPVIRADGATTIPVTASVTTAAGNFVANVQVRFLVFEGGGAIAPASVTTNQLGQASAVYTAGTQPGSVTIVASIERDGVTTGDAVGLHLDPLAVSEPLLAADQCCPLMGSWSADGNSVVFHAARYDEFALYKLSLSGGTGIPEYLGAYRGGAPATDGSGFMAVYDASAGYDDNSAVHILDQNGAHVAGPIRPAQFYGSVRAVAWSCAGDSLLMGSNTNQLVVVTPPDGLGARRSYLPLWANSFSCATGSSSVVVWGSGEPGGIVVWDQFTDESRRLVTDDWYNSLAPEVSGASVDPAGATVVYSARPSPIESDEDDHDLLSIPFAGGTPAAFLSSPVEEFYPVWSPDGSKILFCSNRSGAGYNLYIFDVD